MPRSGFTGFQPASSGFRQILTSEKVRADLQRRAEKVKATADAELQGLQGPYPAVDVSSDSGSKRASATVSGVPLPLEESRRILGRAIDAAGD